MNSSATTPPPRPMGAQSAGTPREAKTKKAPGRAARVVRIVFGVLIALLFAAIVIQVLMIGFGIFYEARFLALHAEIGWITAHMFGPITLIVGFFARLGWKFITINAVNLVLLAILPILAGIGNEARAAGEASLAGGLHPFVAVTVFTLTGLTAWHTLRLIQQAAPTDAPGTAGAQTA